MFIERCALWRTAPPKPPPTLPVFFLARTKKSSCGAVSRIVVGEKQWGGANEAWGWGTAGEGGGRGRKGGLLGVGGALGWKAQCEKKWSKQRSSILLGSSYGNSFLLLKPEGLCVTI